MVFSLRRHPAFTLFWASQSLSNLGDAFSAVGLQLLVIRETGSIVTLALLTSIWGVARLAASVLAGPVVDVIDRRKLMLVCDAGRAVLLLMMPLGHALSLPAMPLLYLLVVLVPALSAFFEVAYITAVPGLVDAEHVERANTTLWTSRAAALASGPALAGLVSHVWGPLWALGLDGVSFAISGLALCMLRFRHAAAGPARDDVPAVAGVRGLTAGLRFLIADPVLLAITLTGGGLALMNQGATNLVMFRLKIGLAADDVVAGGVLAIGSIGGILGAVAAPRVRSRLGLAGALCCSTALQALGVIWLGVAWLPLAMGPGALVALLGDWLQGSIALGLYQQRVPQAVSGRVVAAHWTLRQLVTSPGTMLVGMVAAGLGAGATLLAIGSVLLGIAAASLVLVRRAERVAGGPG
jgi:hypothetical protein